MPASLTQAIIVQMVYCKTESGEGPNLHLQIQVYYQYNVVRYNLIHGYYIIIQGITAKSAFKAQTKGRRERKRKGTDEEGVPGSITGWGVCDFFRLCQSFTSKFPFPLSLPFSFPSSSSPFHLSLLHNPLRGPAISI